MTPGVDSKVLLSVRNVRKSFARRGLWRTLPPAVALSDVSLDLRPGEILGVVGESGSGKSTLAKILLGLERADSGTVELSDRTLVGDRPPCHCPPAQRGIGMVFQDPYSSINPRHRARDIIGEGLLIARRSSPHEVRARVDEVLELVGLRREDGDKYPYQFSGGQRQRVCIARALALQPELLIADEAVSALDVSVQMQIMNLLLNLRDRLGLSLLFITHNIGVVEYLCDRVVVMARGKVVEEGTCRAVIGAPREAYTRDLIAAVPRLQLAERRAMTDNLTTL